MLAEGQLSNLHHGKVDIQGHCSHHPAHFRVSLHAQLHHILQQSDGSHHKQLLSPACELIWSSLPSGLHSL